MIVSHGSTVRALSRLILNFTQEESSKFSIPNAMPILIKLKEKSLELIEWKYLGDDKNIKDRIKLV